MSDVLALSSRRARLITALLLCSLALAGCGSGTPTDAVAEAATSGADPAAPTSTPPATAPTSIPTPTPTPTPAPTQPAAPAPAPSPTAPAAPTPPAAPGGSTPTAGPVAAAPGSGTVVPVAGQTLSMKASQEDMEALGPFASWRTAKSYGAVGDGVADDTAALQRALDELVQPGSAKVLHLQAGTYRLTATLKFDATKETYGAALIGDDPATTRIVWDGPVGAPMLIANGGVHTSFARITWDGRSKAGIGVAHWWRASGPLYGGSAEHADEVFVDMAIGIMGGRNGSQYGQLDSEGQVRRVKFVRNTKAGLSVGSFNALNWWVWDSQFTDCARGVTNKFSVGDGETETQGAGSFFVYRSLFERSKVVDAEIGHTGTFGIYSSTSIGSRRFFHSDRMGLNTARETLQGNRVLDTTDPVAVYNGNLGPLSLIDNEFRSLPGAAAPVVRLDNPVVGSDVVSVGNRFTVANAIQPADALNRVLSIDDRTVDRTAIDGALPRLPGVPARSSRQVFEVARGANGAAIQAAIDAAVAAAGRGVVNPVVHLPAGDYSLDRTLTVPANTRIQIAGDSIGTQINSALPAGAAMIRLAGPSRATVRDLRLNGQSQQAIVIDNADQAEGRILIVGSALGPVAATGLGRTRLSMQANPMLAKMNLSGVASALSLGTGGFGPVSLRQNSHLLMSDNWYEGTASRLFQLESGRLTYRGGHMAPADPVHGGGTVEPAIALDAFRGSATFLGMEMNIQNAGNGVRVGQTTPDTRALFLGVAANKARFFSGDASVGSVGLMFAKEPVGMGVSALVSAAAIGPSSDAFVREMLTQARSVAWQSAPEVTPAGATDVRIYRVMTQDTATGLQVSGTP